MRARLGTAATRRRSVCARQCGSGPSARLRRRSAWSALAARIRGRARPVTCDPAQARAPPRRRHWLRSRSPGHAHQSPTIPSPPTNQPTTRPTTKHRPTTTHRPATNSRSCYHRPADHQALRHASQTRHPSSCWLPSSKQHALLRRLATAGGATGATCALNVSQPGVACTGRVPSAGGAGPAATHRSRRSGIDEYTSVCVCVAATVLVVRQSVTCQLVAPAARRALRASARATAITAGWAPLPGPSFPIRWPSPRPLGRHRSTTTGPVEAS